MIAQTFSNISLWQDGVIDDTGTLTIGDDSVQFDGSNETLKITDIQFVSIGKRSGFSLGDWVKVEYINNFQTGYLYLKTKGRSGGVDQIYEAMQHFPNSGQFECFVWAYRNRLRPAPRKPGSFTSLKRGYIAATREKNITLSVRGQRTHEVALSEAEGFQWELLTARQQLVIKVLEMFLTGVLIGLILGVASLFLQSDPSRLSFVDSIKNFSFLFVLGFTPVFLGGLLLSIPTLVFIRNFSLFTIKLAGGRQWDFGVLENRVEKVKDTLKSYGIKNKTF